MKLYIQTGSGKTEMDLDPGQYTLGAAEDNSIQIGHPSVSSHHVVIDVSTSGQTVIQSQIPSGIIDSDGTIQDLLTLFPGDYCMLGEIQIGRESALPAPPPPPPQRVTVPVPEDTEEQVERNWTDIFHYPFRKDAWVMFLIMMVLMIIPHLIPRFLALPAAILGLALAILYGFTMLGTCKEIIRTTLAGDNDLEMPIGDSFDWENSKDIFLGYFLLSIGWMAPYFALNWIPLESAWAKPLALAFGLSMLPMGWLMMVVHDNVLAGFHIPGMIQAIFRAPMVYAAILALIGIIVGMEMLMEAGIDPARTPGLLIKLVQVIAGILDIYGLLVISRALGLYARNYMRQ
ncbi:MAG: hypothetical protein ACFHW5_11470 [Verrucomicrobiota bacterium]